MALGVYPEVSLKEAREKRDEARKLLSNEIDPSVARRAKKLQLIKEADNTFAIIAAEWYAKMKSKWSEDHAKRKGLLLEKNVFPTFGKSSINNITSKELLNLLDAMQSRGAIENAHKIKGICSEVFRYGIYTGRCDRDPS